MSFMLKVDSEYIEALRNDDEKAYERLRLFSYKRVFNYIRNHEDAEDIASDVLIQIRQSIKKKYKPSKGKGTIESNFKAWIKEIIFNKYLDFRKRQQREATLDQLSGALNLTDDDRDVIEKDFNSIDKMLSIKAYDSYPFRHNPQWSLAAQEVIEATKKLNNPKKRIALLLMYLCGFTEEEISELMKENFHAIQTVIHRARKEMKTIFEKYGIDAEYLLPESWRIKNLIH